MLFYLSFLRVPALVLLFLMPILPAMKIYNQRVLRGKNKTFNTWYKRVRTFHPIAGGLIIILGLLHGYAMLGGQLRFHTGSLIIIMLLGAVIMSILMKRNKAFKIAHPTFGLLAIVAFLVHYIAPWLFG